MFIGRLAAWRSVQPWEADVVSEQGDLAAFYAQIISAVSDISPRSQRETVRSPNFSPAED